MTNDSIEQLRESVPSPLKLREMLEDMAVKELLGPVGGETEEVAERIRDRYLVGILAPPKRTAETDGSSFGFLEVLGQAFGKLR